MVCTQHDTHLNKAGRIFRKLTLEPQQADDIANNEVSSDEGTHGHAIVSGLLPPVIANAAHYVCGDPHLKISLGLAKVSGKENLLDSVGRRLGIADLLSRPNL